VPALPRTLPLRSYSVGIKELWRQSLQRVFSFGGVNALLADVASGFFLV
jgi:hypothetical protein